jgi:hypothetical protein
MGLATPPLPFRAVCVQSNEPSAHPYFHNVLPSQCQEPSVVWLAPPSVRMGWVDDYQKTFVSGTRDNHLAACRKPLVANFSLADQPTADKAAARSRSILVGRAAAKSGLAVWTPRVVRLVQLCDMEQLTAKRTCSAFSSHVVRPSALAYRCARFMSLDPIGRRTFSI